MGGYVDNDRSEAERIQRANAQSEAAKAKKPPEVVHGDGIIDELVAGRGLAPERVAAFKVEFQKLHAGKKGVFGATKDSLKALQANLSPRDEEMGEVLLMAEQAVATEGFRQLFAGDTIYHDFEGADSGDKETFTNDVLNHACDRFRGMAVQTTDTRYPITLQVEWMAALGKEFAKRIQTTSLQKRVDNDAIDGLVTRILEDTSNGGMGSFEDWFVKTHPRDYVAWKIEADKKKDAPEKPEVKSDDKNEVAAVAAPAAAPAAKDGEKPAAEAAQAQPPAGTEAAKTPETPPVSAETPPAKPGETPAPLPEPPAGMHLIAEEDYPVDGIISHLRPAPDDDGIFNKIKKPLFAAYVAFIGFLARFTGEHPDIEKWLPIRDTWVSSEFLADTLKDPRAIEAVKGKARLRDEMGLLPETMKKLGGKTVEGFVKEFKKDSSKFTTDAAQQARLTYLSEVLTKRGGGIEKKMVFDVVGDKTRFPDLKFKDSGAPTTAPATPAAPLVAGQNPPAAPAPATTPAVAAAPATPAQIQAPAPAPAAAPAGPPPAPTAKPA